MRRGPSPLELDIRRWWILVSKRYQTGTAYLTDKRGWAYWRQIGLCLQWLDEERAANDENPTAKHPTPLPEHDYVPTSDDTIAVDWSKISPPSNALTPAKPFPVAPSVPLPPAHGLLTDIELWNAAIAQAIADTETALNQARLEHLDAFATKSRVVARLQRLRKPVPMEPPPLDDPGYTR